MDSDASSPSGHARQVRVLAQQLAPYLGRLKSRYSLSREDSADLLQNALLAYWTYRPRVEHPIRWLFSVLRNDCLRIVRRGAHREVRLEDLGERAVAELASQPPVRLGDTASLEEILSALSPRNQKVLWMRFVAGMNWREIANVLGCGPSGAKKAVFRAVSAARELAAKT